MSDTANLVLSDRSSQIPVCASLSSSPETTNTTLLLHINTTVAHRLEVNANNNVVAVNVEQCGWVRVYFIDEFLVNVTKEAEFSGSFFSCTVSSQWESLSIDFTVHEDRTTQPQMCQSYPSPQLAVSPTPSHSPEGATNDWSTTHSLPQYPPHPTILSQLSFQTATTSVLTLNSMPTTSPPFPFVQTGSPTPSDNDRDKNELPIPIIAGGVVVLFVVTLIVVGVIFIFLFVCWRRRKRAAIRKMYKLPVNEDSFTTEQSLAQPSFISLHTHDAHQLSNGHSVTHQFTHNGVQVSRQMAKVLNTPTL